MRDRDDLKWGGVEGGMAGVSLHQIDTKIGAMDTKIGEKTCFADIPLWCPKTILWYLPLFLRNSCFPNSRIHQGGRAVFWLSYKVSLAKANGSQNAARVFC